MPVSTPSWARNQQQYQRQQNSGRSNPSGDRDPLPQHGRKNSQHWRGREAQTLSGRKYGVGGVDGGRGPLKDMFERARSKAEEEKENIPPKRDAAGLQDVSEIVIACRSGQTPARGTGSGSRTPATAAAVPNPFAKKLAAASATKTTAASPNPTDFSTPCAPTAGGGVRSNGDATHLQGYAGGDSDAWSRLSKGCMMAGGRAEEDSAGVQSGGVVLMDVRNQAETGRGVKGVEFLEGTISAAAEVVGVKRSLSTPLPSGNGGSGGGKKKPKFGGSGGRKSHTQPPCGAGKGVTMLSFFGRAAVSKP